MASIPSTPDVSRGDSTSGDARWVRLFIGLAAIGYFLLASLRYFTFRAGVSDLGYFDQAVYLISRGQRPFIPTLGFHILADHGAWVLYPLALLYKIHPTVLWLLAVQAVVLAGGAWLVWRLARQAGVASRWALAASGAWLVYPAVVMPNLHDFHPDCFAAPALLGAVLCARERRPLGFALCVIIALGTKEVMAITVGAMGLWLLCSEKDWRYGAAAILSAVIWFVFVTQIVIPHFGQGHQLNGYRFLSYMGRTPGAIIRTMILHPGIPLGFIASKQTVVYLLVLLAPVWWGLSVRHLAPLLAAAPCVAINLLSNEEFLRNPFYHYSLPAAPFVFLAVLSALAAARAWLSRPWMVGAWLGLVLLGGGAARGRQMSFGQSLTGSSRAVRVRLIDMVNDDGGVLSTHQLTSHLMHRTMAYYVFDPPSEPAMRLPPDDQIEWVLLDFHEDSLIETGDFGRNLLLKYQASPDYVQLHGADDLYLFHRTAR